MKKNKFILVVLLVLGLIFFVSCKTRKVAQQNETKTTSKDNVSTEFTKEDENEELSNENATEETEELPFIKSELKLEMQTEILTTDMIQDMEKNIKPFVEGDIIILEHIYKSMMAPNAQDMTYEHTFVFKQYSCNSQDNYELYVTWDEFDYQGEYINSGSTKGILESKYVIFISYWTLDINGDLNYDLMLKVQDCGTGTVDDKPQEVVLVFLAVPGSETGWEYAGCYRADYIDDDEIWARQFLNGLE